MPVDSALLTEAAVAIDKGFVDALAAGPQPGDPIGQFCKTINTSSRRVKSIVNGLPARWREWLGERVFNDVSRYALEFTNRTFELSHKMNVDDLDDDQYGWGDIGKGMGEEALLWPRDMFFEALLAATASDSDNPSYDGQPFFDADHPFDPADPDSDVYSNYDSTGKALTAANLAAAVTAMRLFKAPNGRTLNVRPVKLWVPPQLEFTAKAILDPLLIAAASGAPVSNIYQGILTFEVLPELEAEPTAWYLQGEARGLKPCLFSLRKVPQIDVLNRPTDQNVFMHNEIQWGGKARGAVIPALPFLLYKAVA